MKSFGSDNHSGVHSRIMNAIVEANVEHELSYGDDKYTQIAEQKFNDLFGDVKVFFVMNGTGANVTALSSVIRSYNSIICAATAHINVDECGAPEKLSGAKVISVPTLDGKLTPELVRPLLIEFGVCHHSQPKVITISLTTELGTVYSLDEIRALAELAHSYNMYLHVDGARFANGLVAIGCSAKEFRATGVDLMSFGGTKNGMMMGEAVVFFNHLLGLDYQFVRKQSMQLYSKMRFVAAQFIAYLENDLWLELARHSNEMAQLLYTKLLEIKEIKLTQKPSANALFLILPEDKREIIRQKYFFYDWDENIGEIRLMTSFNTTREDVEQLVEFIKQTLEK